VNRKKILITGKSGYIARALQLALKDDYEVTAIGRADFDLGDMHDTDQWFQGRFFDVVLHTAAIIPDSSVPPRATGQILTTNFNLFYNIHRCRASFGRLIVFGSGAEFQEPPTEYGKSKAIISRFIDADPQYYNLRLYGVFDENELPTRFIKSNITRYLNKQSLLMREEKKMDFFYMPDLVSLVRFYIEAIVPEKHIDCCYEAHVFLSYIADYIRTLDSFKAAVTAEIERIDKNQTYQNRRQFRGTDYIGTYSVLPFEPIGLHAGIKEVYQKLKLEHSKNQANIGA